MKGLDLKSLSQRISRGAKWQKRIIRGQWEERIMKALVYRGPEVLSFQDMPDPQPERREVLLKVAGGGICGSALHAFWGHE